MFVGSDMNFGFKGLPGCNRNLTHVSPFFGGYSLIGGYANQSMSCKIDHPWIETERASSGLAKAPFCFTWVSLCIQIIQCTWHESWWEQSAVGITYSFPSWHPCWVSKPCLKLPKSYQPYIDSWTNYSDRSPPVGHPKWWFSKGIPQVSALNSGLGIIVICPGWWMYNGLQTMMITKPIWNGYLPNKRQHFATSISLPGLTCGGVVDTVSFHNFTWLVVDCFVMSSFKPPNHTTKMLQSLRKTIVL